MTTSNATRPPGTAGAIAAWADRPSAAWVAAAGLLLGVVLLYLPSFGNDFIRGYDDSTYILSNDQVLGGLTPGGVAWAFTTTYAVNWLPLTWLSHMLDVSVYGLNPVGHHATSIVLHGLNAALLQLALRRLTGRLGPSLAVAVLFAVHPLRVESVSWVAERKDVLSGAFFLAALWAYAWYTERPSGRRYALVAVLHALGLMSKTMLVTFPFVLLLLDWWPLRRMAVGGLLPLPAESDRLDGRSGVARSPVTVGRAVLEKVPLLALSLIASAWTFLFQREGGAMEFGATLSLADRLSTAVVCVPRYLASTFWPSGLAVLYPHPGHWPAWEVAAAGGLILAVTLLCWLARRRAPYLLVGWLWFLGMLVPVSGVVQVGVQSMADRYTYLPGIGLAIAVVWLATQGLSRAGAASGGRTIRWVGPAAVAAASVALGAVTLVQQVYWADAFTLFSRAVAVTDGNYLAHAFVGTGYFERGQFRSALAEFRKAGTIQPQWPNAHFNIGNALAALGDNDEAIFEYREAIRLNPKMVAAHYQLGRVYLDGKKMPNEAIGPFTEATRLQPGWAEAQAGLARALVAAGRSDEAADRLRQAAAGRGGSADMQNNLGVELMKAGKLPEATVAFREAVRLDPGHARAHFNLGFALSRQRQFEGAVAEYREAVRLQPGGVDGRLGLANALGELGRYDEAERELVEVVRLDPQNARAARVLQNLRNRPGR